jgi:hypothetical protein
MGGGMGWMDMDGNSSNGEKGFVPTRHLFIKPINWLKKREIMRVNKMIGQRHGKDWGWRSSVGLIENGMMG